MPNLPQELVSLVHHVHLNQNGWWGRAMERMVLATVWVSEQGLRPADLVPEIRRQYSVGVDSRQLHPIVDRLRSRGDIVVLATGELKISEQRLKELEREREYSRRQEAATKARFHRELEATGLPLAMDLLWDQFNERWLQPTVCSLGARTYELIVGNYQDWLSNADVDAFLHFIPDEGRGAVREALGRFLDPRDPDVRGYLLRYMDAYFVVEASRLSDRTVADLGTLSGSHPEFVLLLDTNVILSILGLHGESKRDAATLLLDLTARLQGRVDVKIYALPLTIDETRVVLERERDALGKLRMSRTAAEAAIASGELGDVASAFAEAAVKSGQTLTSDDFFGPYISDLAGILRQRGIEMYNASIDHLDDDAGVQADIAAQFDFERSRYGQKAKRRSQIRHDVLLWYLANKKRPPRVESPTDAHFWIVTEDFRLAAFDAYKRGRDGIPLCVQPLTLVQILQFWTGRTEGIEQALLGGLRLSLLAPQFDAQAETATITILRTLARYENVDDLPVSAVAHVLVNDALRQRLVATADEEEQVKLVRDELFAEHRRVLDERDAHAQRASELADQNARLAAHREEAVQESAATGERLAALQRELDAARDALRAEQTLRSSESEKLIAQKDREAELAASLANLATSTRLLKASEQSRQLREQRASHSLRWFLLPSLGFIALAVLIYALPPIGNEVRQWQIGIPGLSLYVLLWLFMQNRAAAGRDFANNWRVYMVLNHTRRTLYALLAGIAMAVLGSIAYDDWFKPLERSLTRSSAPNAHSSAPDPTSQRSRR